MGLLSRFREPGAGLVLTTIFTRVLSSTRHVTPKQGPQILLYQSLPLDVSGDPKIVCINIEQERQLKFVCPPSL